MQCSIIIVNYNTFELTAACIRSVIDHVHGPYTYEIIVVDNGSSERASNEFKSRFPSITLVKSDVNLGFAKGNNLGIKQAKGEFILLLNSDTEFLNDALTPCVEVLMKDRGIGVVSGQLQFPDGRLQAVAGVFPSLIRELKELLRFTAFYRGEKRSRYYLGDAWDYSLPLEADWVWGAFFMFRRSDLAYFPNSLLHDNFFMYYEDVQWCYHFKMVVGKKVFYTPLSKAVHYMGKSNRESQDQFEKYVAKMLPNEHQWLRITKGGIYARLYYLVKALYYFSLRRSQDLLKGRVFLRYAFK